MKIQFERRPHVIYAELTEPGECDRLVEVARASDAFRIFGAFTRDIDPIALKPLDALFSYARVVRVDIERRAGGWRVGVVYWSGATGMPVQYETEAPSLIVALTRALTELP